MQYRRRLRTRIVLSFLLFGASLTALFAFYVAQWTSVMVWLPTFVVDERGGTAAAAGFLGALVGNALEPPGELADVELRVTYGFGVGLAAADSRLTELYGVEVESPYSYWFACRPRALESQPVRIFRDWLVNLYAAD